MATAPGIWARSAAILEARTRGCGIFGDTNILVNDTSDRVTGVIDFGSAAIGDPAVAIAGILSSAEIGVGLTEPLRPLYPAVDELVERARLYMSTFAIDEALLGVRGNDSDAIERGIARFK